MATAKRRRFTGEEKAAILRRHLVEQVPVSNLCDEYGLNPTVFGSKCRQCSRSSAAVAGRSGSVAVRLFFACDAPIVTVAGEASKSKSVGVRLRIEPADPGHFELTTFARDGERILAVQRNDARIATGQPLPGIRRPAAQVTLRLGQAGRVSDLLTGEEYGMVDALALTIDPIRPTFLRVLPAPDAGPKADQG